MKSRLLLLVLALSFLAACGGSNKSSSSSSSSGGAVSISPTSASVPTNTTAQFTATVSNSSSGVYWSVNGVIGGNLTSGTISTAGLYTAPAVVPSPATVTITATSLADTTQSATSSITITSGTAISFSISPSTASVYTGRTLQFSTSFNTSANTAVTWEVNSTIGGDTTHGTISSTGVYTAPPTVPSPAAVTITAISQADPTKTATATVTVVLGTTIVVSPSIITVPAGGTQAFSATANSNPIAVTWTLNCNSTATNGCGTVTTAGGTANATATYTAPPFPPSGGGAVSITATSTDQSALPASANIVVQVSNGTLVGSYAYSFTGKNNGTAYASAGSVTFDGAGNVTGGSEDLNASAATTATITGGSYHIGVDGRGNATIITSGGTETWQIVVKDNTKAYIMRSDAGVTGTGTLYLQDASKFAIGSITGNYALRLSGPAAGQTGSAAVAAVLTANGAGVISSGKLDASQGTTASTNLAATGVYTGPSATNGRGTLTVTSTFGTQILAYYLVDATRAVVVETDAGKTLRGDIVKQAGTTFTLGTYANSYAMVLSGANATAPVAIGSVFTLDGTGNLSSGTGDVNTNGNAQNGVAMTSGTYTTPDSATGRTELTVSINGQARKFVLYPEATGIYNVLEIDNVQTTSGRAYVQVSGVTASLWAGTYEGTLSGTEFINLPGEKDAVGLFIPNGGSAITGTLDFNSNGTLNTAVGLSGTYLTSATAGRLTGSSATTAGTLLTGQFVVYIVDANRALIMASDSNRILVGQMEKPF